MRMKAVGTWRGSPRRCRRLSMADGFGLNDGKRVPAWLIGCYRGFLWSGQPATASGVRFRWGDLVRPACRHDPAWRNTGLRTAATTSGVAKMLASGHRLRQRRRAGATPNGKPRGGVPDRNPALTQLCRGLEMAPTTACRRYAPVAPGCVKARLKSRLCSEMSFPPAMWLYLCDISLHAMWRMRCHKRKCIKLWLIEINMTDILKKYQIFLLFINNCEYLCAKLIQN